LFLKGIDEYTSGDVLEFVLEWKCKKEMKRIRKLMWLKLLEMCTPLEG